MPDVVNLISRVLLSSVFIVYGLFKFMDVSSITNNAGTKRFMDLIAGGAPAPTWLGYLIAAIEFLGGSRFWSVSRPGGLPGPSSPGSLW